MDVLSTSGLRLAALDAGVVLRQARRFRLAMIEFSSDEPEALQHPRPIEHFVCLLDGRRINRQGESFDKIARETFLWP